MTKASLLLPDVVKIAIGVHKARLDGNPSFRSLPVLRRIPVGTDLYIINYQAARQGWVVDEIANHTGKSNAQLRLRDLKSKSVPLQNEVRAKKAALAKVKQRLEKLTDEGKQSPTLTAEFNAHQKDYDDAVARMKEHNSKEREHMKVGAPVAVKHFLSRDDVDEFYAGPISGAFDGLDEAPDEAPVE